jgi:hypothetical protein
MDFLYLINALTICMLGAMLTGLSPVWFQHDCSSEQIFYRHRKSYCLVPSFSGRGANL